MNTKNQKLKIKPVLAAVGAGIALSLATIPMANAASSNHFSSEKLASGYNVASNHSNMEKSKDGKCGSGKCGNKAKEGKCGGAKCDHKKSKSGGGKCGHGKCGG